MAIDNWFHPSHIHRHLIHVQVHVEELSWSIFIVDLQEKITALKNWIIELISFNKTSSSSADHHDHHLGASINLCVPGI